MPQTIAFSIVEPQFSANWEIRLKRWDSPVPRGLVEELLAGADVKWESWTSSEGTLTWTLKPADAGKFRRYLADKFASPRALMLWVEERKRAYKAKKAAASNLSKEEEDRRVSLARTAAANAAFRDTDTYKNLDEKTKAAVDRGLEITKGLGEAPPAAYKGMYSYD